MKILFISSNIASSLHGGWQCSIRNLESLKQIFDSNMIEVVILNPFNIDNYASLYAKIKCITTNFFRLLFTWRMNGITIYKENRIIQRIKILNSDFVFIDSSLNGFLIKKIKKQTNCKLIVFFHNHEYSFIRKNLFSITSIFRLYPSYINEKTSVQYADRIVVLNQRDKKLIQRYYKTEKEINIIPISLRDKCCALTLGDFVENKQKLNALFVGSNFYANRQGLFWFIKNVLPYVNINLTVVGKGMNKVSFSETVNIMIYSDVVSIDEFYINADIVIAPIFTGGGMKVKIAEALMYNKILIGTSEALEGYDYNEVSSIILCNKACEFVNTINFLQPMHVKSRQLYLRKYSFDATIPLFKALFE